jgi:hypothetical protein
MSSLQQNQRITVQNRFCLEAGEWEVAQIMYTHVSKWKNGKINFSFLRILERRNYQSFLTLITSVICKINLLEEDHF